MWPRPAALLLALVASPLAWGQASDQPERILRLNYLEGDVELRGGEEHLPLPSGDRLLQRGDRVTTGDGRAELLLDGSAIRLDERSELRVLRLSAARIQLGLERGVVNLHLRGLLVGERLEISTASASVAPREPGEYRLEARAADQAVLTVHAGAADVATSGGTVRVSSGQRVMLDGSISRATLVPPVPADTFDDWVLDREVLLADRDLPAGPDDYVSGELPDDGGRWYDDATYGSVWMSDTRITSSSSSFFFGFSSGHWVFLSGPGRWCWVPERPVPTPHPVRETHPFGRPRAVANQPSITYPPRESPVHRYGFGSSGASGASGWGGSSQASSPGATSPRPSTSSRSSASFGRPRASSSSTSSPASVFAGPGNR